MRYVKHAALAAVVWMLFPLADGVSQSVQDQASRQRFSLNGGWGYLEQNPPTVDQASRVTNGWESVELPHTWNRTDAVDQIPGYRRSGSWYRRTLFIPASRNDLRYILVFEGINMTADVYVNGNRAGGHVGGYVGFFIDITPFVAKGKDNAIYIRVDNSYDPDVIPSQKSDFVIYGGITRNVWLDVVPSTRIGRLLIRTPSVSQENGETTLEVSLVNETPSDFVCELSAVIRDRRGKQVAAKKLESTLTPGMSSRPIVMPSVSKPELWSPKDPALYTVTVQLRQQGKTIDEVSERCGYRWYEFKSFGPFYLNGERVLLRGTHRHEDYAGYGNAMPDSLHRKDMQLVKELGANFVRLGHYPQAPEVYRACDELGILVWDELPWCRGGMGGERWNAITKRLLREQVLQNLNHPSIIIFSLGNELYWLPDVAGGDQMDSLRGMVKELNDIVHALDPTRVTATRKFTEGADLVDLVSPSIWPGWYSGVFNMYQRALDDAHKNFARFIHAEYGGDSHRGRHSENPVTGDGMKVSDGWEENIKPQPAKNVAQLSDWSENYIVDLFDWYLHVSERIEWLAGTAQYLLKDFPTPLRPENPIPYINEKGLVDRAGNRKDAFYVFKSYWTTSPKFCYIESHTWTERTGPPQLMRLLKVFSNCEEVELFVNGVSQGMRRRDIGVYPACGLTWDILFAAGENTVRAVGYNNGTAVTVDSTTVRYRHKKNTEADHIELWSEPTGDGNILLTALAVDKHGQRCLDYNKRIYFASDGDGSLVVNMGTPIGSAVIEMANGRAQIEFVPVKGGRAVIEARNQDFKGAYLVIDERIAAMKPD